MLVLCPITLKDAQDFVRMHHRHHSTPPIGHRFAVGVEQDAELVGVVMAGRPISRHYDDGYTLEVNRTCVADSVPNANSMLYAAAWRAAKALGYNRLITYTQEGESGSSLRAAGFRTVAERPARGSWASSSVRRRRTSDVGGVARTLWEAV